MRSKTSSLVGPPALADGYGTWNTPGTSGANPSRCTALLPVTAMPAVKSRNSLPSTSVIQSPSPFATTSGYGRVKLVESAALSRPTSAAARGPGRLAATFGRLAPERTDDVVVAATVTPSYYA